MAINLPRGVRLEKDVGVKGKLDEGDVLVFPGDKPGEEIHVTYNAVTKPLLDGMMTANECHPTFEDSSPPSADPNITVREQQRFRAMVDYVSNRDGDCVKPPTLTSVRFSKNLRPYIEVKTIPSSGPELAKK